MHFGPVAEGVALCSQMGPATRSWSSVTCASCRDMGVKLLSRLEAFRIHIGDSPECFTTLDIRVRQDAVCRTLVNASHLAYAATVLFDLPDHLRASVEAAAMDLHNAMMAVAITNPEPPRIKCTWCNTSAAHADWTRQAWTRGSYWSGAPVCERCALKCAPNERVVDRSRCVVIHAATEPDVPSGYHAPRSRKKRVVKPSS